MRQTSTVDPDRTPWLLVLCGRAGTGKITLAKRIVRETGACYLRVDAVETALRRHHNDVGADGYVVVHEVAVSNLTLGVNVVVDAVSAVPEARAGWSASAQRAGARLIVVETHLPDSGEHRRRVESRTADLPGHVLPTWADVQQDGWVDWDLERDGSRTLIDTTDGDAVRAILALVDVTTD